MKCPGRKVQLPVYDDEYWNTTFRVAIKTGKQINYLRLFFKCKKANKLNRYANVQVHLDEFRNRW